MDYSAAIKGLEKQLAFIATSDLLPEKSFFAGGCHPADAQGRVCRLHSRAGVALP